MTRTRLTKEQIKQIWDASAHNAFVVPVRDEEPQHQWLARVRAEAVVHARSLGIPEDWVRPVADQLVAVALMAARIPLDVLMDGADDAHD